MRRRCRHGLFLFLWLERHVGNLRGLLRVERPVEQRLLLEWYVADATPSDVHAEASRAPLGDVHFRAAAERLLHPPAARVAAQFTLARR